MLPEVDNRTKHIISEEDINRLYPYANDGRKWYVDPKYPKFTDRIIELYFEEKGHDFWDMPEVDEWEVSFNPTTITLYTK